MWGKKKRDFCLSEDLAHYNLEVRSNIVRKNDAKPFLVHHVFPELLSMPLLSDQFWNVRTHKLFDIKHYDKYTV